MKKKIRRLLREVERRGGMVVLDESIPDDVAEQFLNEVLSCPDCCTRTGSNGVALNEGEHPIYGIVTGRGRANDH